ncbi:hypothetical protein B0H12DRAFT_1109662 [Mycena haematopus]|nr:hypothetical protein B0H12DRAFT_1109662 [Mycena haematopus]
MNLLGESLHVLCSGSQFVTGDSFLVLSGAWIPLHPLPWGWPGERLRGGNKFIWRLRNPYLRATPKRSTPLRLLGPSCAQHPHPPRPPSARRAPPLPLLDSAPRRPHLCSRTHSVVPRRFDRGKCLSRPLASREEELFQLLSESPHRRRATAPFASAVRASLGRASRGMVKFASPSPFHRVGCLRQR